MAKTPCHEMLIVPKDLPWERYLDGRPSLFHPRPFIKAMKQPNFAVPVWALRRAAEMTSGVVDVQYTTTFIELRGARIIERDEAMEILADFMAEVDSLLSRSERNQGRPVR